MSKLRVAKHGAPEGRSVGKSAPRPELERTNSLCIITYNIHRCIGGDHKVSPERISDVIAAHQPDIVALQEEESRSWTLPPTPQRNWHSLRAVLHKSGPSLQ